MPGHVFLGRSWRWASDDLPLPSTFAAFTQAVWAIVLFSFIPDLADVKDSESCPKTPVLDLLSALNVLMVFNFVISSLITAVTLQGSIWETRKRSAVNFLVPLDFAVWLTTLAANGTAYITSSEMFCAMTCF